MMNLKEKLNKLITAENVLRCVLLPSFFAQLLLSNMGPWVWLDLTCEILAFLSLGMFMFLLAKKAWPTDKRPYGLIFIPIGCVFLVLSFMVTKDFALDLIEGPQTVTLTDLSRGKTGHGSSSSHYLRGWNEDGELMQFRLSFLDYVSYSDLSEESVTKTVVYYAHSNRIIEFIEGEPQ